MKINVILTLFIYSNIIACNVENKKNNYEKKQEKKEFTDMTTSEKIEDIKIDIIPTDKSSQNEKWEHNKYRNYKYKCRLSFPKGWEYDNGTAKSTIARAINQEDGISISLLVTEYKTDDASNKNLSEDEINKIMKEVFSMQNLDPKNVKMKKGWLNNFPADILEMTTVQSAGTKTYNNFTKQISCIINSTRYTIGINLPYYEWTKKTSDLFDKVVESFNFELAY